MRKFCWVLLAILTAANAARAEIPEGWQVVRDGAACEADFPQISGPQATPGAMLTIAVMPPQHLLLLQHPDFPKARQSQAVALSFDGGPVLATESLGSDGIYGLAITPEIGLGLRQGTHLTLAVAGKRYDFAFAHADVAMDEAARCAGTKTLPEIWAAPPKPIPEAPGWALIEGIGGTNQCSVRRNSPEVNTSLALTRLGKLLLIAGRPDWAKWAGDIQAALAIDADPPVAVAAGGFQNLVLLPVVDEAMVKKLEAAKTLTWHLPWGDFTAEVEGLGAAEAVLRACDAKQAKEAAPAKP